MTMLEKLQADLKDAMRSGDVIARETLRMVISSLKNRRIETGEDLDEANELQVLHKAVKTRQEAAEQADKANRQDLADKERSEMVVIQRYLPQQMGEDEVRALVEKAIADQGLTSKSELGLVMKAVLGEHKGRVDGKLVQRLASELLG